MAKELRIAMLGCGFMGRTHSNAWLQVNHFFPREHQPVLKGCYGRQEDLAKLKDFQAKWGYESIETDWRKLVERDDIDLIDVCTPNFMHKDCVIAAAEAGKIVVCEKPMAMNMAEAQQMVDAVEKAGATQGWSYTIYEEEWNYGFHQEMAHFVDCVALDQTPLVTGRDGRAVLEAIFAAYESAGTGRKVALPFPTDAAKPIDLWRLK